MSMSAGLPEDDPWADRHMDLPAAAVDTIFRGGASFAHPPGVAYEYSNLGWVMLGRVVTNVAEAPRPGICRRQAPAAVGAPCDVVGQADCPCSR